MASGRFQAHKFRAGAKHHKARGGFSVRGLGGGMSGGSIGISKGSVQLGKLKSGKLPSVSGPKVRVVASKFRLNQPYWVKKIGRARASALRAQGAFVRRRARQLLRPVGKKGLPSPAGSPPRVRTKSKFRTLKNILFDYDPTLDTVWVGPVGLKREYMNATVPQVHEHGPITVRRTIQYIAEVDGKPRPKPTRSDVITGAYHAKGRRAKSHMTDTQREAFYKLAKSGRVRRARFTYIARYPNRNFMMKALKMEARNGGLMRAYEMGWSRSWR